VVVVGSVVVVVGSVVVDCVVVDVVVVSAVVVGVVDVVVVVGAVVGSAVVVGVVEVPVVGVVVVVGPVVVGVVVPAVVVGVVVVVVAAVVVNGWAREPLDSSADSTCCCTAPTCAAIAAGVPPAPRAGRASSFFSADSISSTSCRLGCFVSVTTIWSAIAVVRQAGQLTFREPAASIGAITALRPTISTTWNDTATVVHALQLAKAKAPFVFVTGAPPETVTRAYATL
jgi:hypothetical protein